MSDIAPLSRPALAAVETGTFGAKTATPGIVLTASPEGTVLHLLASPSAKTSADDLAAGLAGTGLSTPRYTAPGQYFAVSDSTTSPQAIANIAEKLGALASVSDQSHGRVRIKVEGLDVEAMLAKGIAVDLNIAAFPVARAATMICGHVTVHATRLSEQAFELMALRGFAEDLWQSLVTMGLEFGIECRRA